MQERGYLHLVTMNPFTPRQRDVIRCVLEGASSREEIAARLGLSGETVKKHVEGRKAYGQPGIYGIIEAAYGRRPEGLYKAIGMMGGDIIVPKLEIPNFQISKLSARRKCIEMQIEDTKWILLENRGTGTAGPRANVIHSLGAKTKADLPFDKKASFTQGRLVPSRPLRGETQRMVGLYVEAEKFEYISRRLKQ